MPRDELDVSKQIMDKISSGEVKMRPRIYFIAGSAAIISGIVGAAVLAVFAVSLISFSLRSHGPMGSYRLQEILASFPWWAPILVIVGFAVGIWLLRRYEFSYKHNPWIIVLAFIIAIVLAGVAIDVTGLSDIWLKRGFMSRYGQGQGAGMGQGKSPGQGTGYGRGSSGTVQK